MEDSFYMANDSLTPETAEEFTSRDCNCSLNVSGVVVLSNVTTACQDVCKYAFPKNSLPLDGLTNSYIPSAMFLVVIYTMYSVIFVVALVGNSGVCGIVFTSIRKWTVTNYFIANMAAGDILMALFCIPFTFVPTLVLLYWPFGEVMCRVVSFSQAVSVFVSAYTMVAISADRYLALVYPLRPRMTKRQAKMIICLVWFAAILTALPIALVSELTIPDSSQYNGHNIEWYSVGNRPICHEKWYYPEQQWQYTMALLTLQYCVPLTLLILLYGRIAFEVWGKKAPGEAHQHRDLQIAQSKRNMIKMMMIVVLVFAVCWLPLNLLQVFCEIYPALLYWEHINYVHFACHWLAMSHSAYNPVIYCCFNSKFRQGFVDIAVRCGCSCLAVHPQPRGTVRQPSSFSTYTYAPNHNNVQMRKDSTSTTNQARASFRFSHHKAENQPLNGSKYVFRASFPQQVNRARQTRFSESQM